MAAGLKFLVEPDFGGGGKELGRLCFPGKLIPAKIVAGVRLESHCVNLFWAGVFLGRIFLEYHMLQHLIGGDVAKPPYLIYPLRGLGANSSRDGSTSSLMSEF